MPARLLVMLSLMAAIPATAQAAPTPTQDARLASIEARLQRAEDELAIRRVLADYAATLDARDYASYAALFTADGEWTGGGATQKGPAAIEAMLARVLGPAGAPNNSDFHIISNPQVTVQGDKATANSRYLFVMRGKDGRPVPSLAGVYTDEFARQADGGWKIRRRVAADVMPSREEWARIIADHARQ